MSVLLLMAANDAYRFPFVRYPALRIALLLGSGIISAALSEWHVSFWGYPLAAAIAMLAGWEYLQHRDPRTGIRVMVPALYLLTIFMFGGFWYSYWNAREAAQPTPQVLRLYEWEEVEIFGTVYTIKPTASGKIRADIAVDSTIFSRTFTLREAYNLRITGGPEQYEGPLLLGNYLNAIVTIYPSDAPRNPYVFDYTRFLTSQNIQGQAGVQEVSINARRSQGLNWVSLREWTLRKIDLIFDEPTIQLARALLIGYKNDLDPGERNAFSRVGLSHIMAVSGLHVGFIIAPFWFVIPFMWTSRHGKWVGLCALLLILFLYAGLTGFSASVVRASVTGGLITFGRLFHKVRDPINLTAVACLIILLLDPGQLFDVGFQLSFAAVFTILLVVPVLHKALPTTLRFRWYGKLLMVVLVSIVVQAGLYPLLSYYFGEFSVFGPLANALVVPGLMLVEPLALLLLVVASLAPGAAYMLNLPCRWFLEHLQWFVQTAAGWRWSWIETPTPGVLLFLIWLAATLGIASMPVPRLRWKMLAVLLFLLGTQQAKELYYDLQAPPMRITMLDVGQGDAIVIETPSGKTVLIDTGPWSATHDSGTFIILPFLKARGIDHLDAVFLSHPHADHIGGMEALLDSIPIGIIYNSGLVYDSDLYRRYVQRAGARSIPIRPLQAGMSLSLEPHLRTYVYGPQPDTRTTDPNAHSLILEFIYGETQFLFTGDAGAEQELQALGLFGSLIDTDFLKVGHHGSRTSSSPAFLAVATPTWAGVSLALRNTFDHPHHAAIAALTNAGTSIAYTSLDGALIYESNGRTISRSPWRYGAPSTRP